jgi:hypothetical protein
MKFRDLIYRFISSADSQPESAQNCDMFCASQHRVPDSPTTAGFTRGPQFNCPWFRVSMAGADRPKIFSS